MNPRKTLVSAVIVLAGLSFVLSVLSAGVASIEGREFDPFLLQIVVVIGGVLSTNLGAVLGITVAPHDSLSRASSKASFLKLKSTFETSREMQPDAIDNYQKLQIIACWVYLITLVLASVFFLATHFLSIGKPVDILLTLSQTLVGVMAGVLAVSLGSQK